MKKTILIALKKFMSENSLTANDLRKLSEDASFYGRIPLYENGEKLPVSIRYGDGLSAETFIEGKPLAAIALSDFALDIKEVPVPLPFDAAIKYCRQMGGHLPTIAEARQVYAKFSAINEVLTNLGYEPLKPYSYWVRGASSKPYLASVFDFSTGQMVEKKKTESFRVRCAF